MDKYDGISEENLTSEHLEKLQEFQCSDEEQVEVFLKEEAYNLMERNLVRTRLFFDKNQNLIGFYSLFNDTIKMSKKKREAMEIRLPDSVKDIPAIRLHYIGVDSRFRKNGYGLYLMASAFYHCNIISKISGCSLITLESTKKARTFYEKFDFIYICPSSCNQYDLMAYPTKSLFEAFD
ncbi:GNAT family N-acetyltransferase [Bacillaceae bacterium SAOS 7]|nr:GNAT family N-acetyltransferase [Bacillaceae bacterium SAOS 7]